MTQTWRWLTISVAVGCSVLGGCIGTEISDTEQTGQAEEALIDGYELNNAPASAQPGASVSVDFVAPAGHPTTDWVGLYEVGAPDYQLVDWLYVPAPATGSVSLDIPASATVGDFYELRYNVDNGYVNAAISTPIEIVPQQFQYTLSNEPSYPSPGSNTSITWTAPAAHSAVDWIGLYPSNAPASGYVSWVYVGSAGLTSGSSSLLLPANTAPGSTFEYRYNVDNTYQVAATSATVTAGNTLTAPVGPVAPGANVSTTWGAPAGHADVDWIGLFEVGAANNEIETWAYVGNSASTTGSVSLTMPLAAPDGQQYEFRYFLNNGYTLVGRSTAFAAGSAYSVDGPAGPVAAGSSITGDWTAPSFHSATDWIGLYEVGATPGEIESYVYVGSPGLTNGSVQITVPAATTPGTYELRYNTNNTYTVVATSNSFLVGCPTGTDDCDGNTANGCETNTATDPLNCGSCNNACGVGSCGGGSCQVAELIVPNVATVAGLASDGASLFFTSGGHAPLYLDGQLLSTPLAGGAPTVLVSGLPTMEAVALDGNQVLFSSDGTPANGMTDGLVGRVSKQGGAYEAFGPNQPYGIDIFVSTGVYYWASSGSPAASYTDGAIRSSVGGAAPSTIAIDTNPAGVYVDGGFVYWTGGAAPGSFLLDGALRRQPIGGGATQDIVIDLNQPESLIIVNGLVYISTEDEVSLVDPAVPGVVSTFANNINDPGNFASDGTDLYWTEPAGRVLRQSLSGGPLIVLAQGLSQPYAITIEGAYVYFSIRGTGADDGGVMRIAR